MRPRAGAGRAERPIRWVHISELEDPTPWLSGGELLLTTGSTSTTAAQAAPLRRAARRAKGGAGLGFGTGFDHERLPEGARRGGAQARPAAVRGALRDAVHRDHRARVHAARQRAVRRARARRRGARAARAPGDRRARARARSSRSIARRASGAALLLDGAGTRAGPPPGARRSRRPTSRRDRDELTRAGRGRAAPHAFEPEAALAGPCARRARPGPAAAAAPAAWLVVVSDERLARRLRAALIARQAAIVVGARADARAGRPRDRAPARRRPARRRARRPPRRRRARGRLRPFGIGARGRRAALRARGPAGGRRRRWRRRSPSAGVAGARRDQRRRRARRSSARSSTARRARPGRGRARALARRSIGAATPACAPPPAARSRLGSLRRAFHEARCALEATSLANGDAPDVASHRDLGAFTLLLSLQDDDALRLYSDGLLAPIERRRGRVRRRAAALARGVHREQRPVGARGARSSTATATRCATGSAGSRS